MVLAGRTLSDQASEVGVDRIRERQHLQPAITRALAELLGPDRVVGERRLRFDHWQGVAGRRLGGVDIIITRPDGPGHEALIELKWCPADGLFMGWAIWDFYKMATGRVSPGADRCYLVAGAPGDLWENPASVAALFRTNTWYTATVFKTYETIWYGDGNDCKKLTHLPHRIGTTLVADVTLPTPLGEWRLKAIRIQPHIDRWLTLDAGLLATSALE